MDEKDCVEAVSELLRDHTFSYLRITRRVGDVFRIRAWFDEPEIGERFDSLEEVQEYIDSPGKDG